MTMKKSLFTKPLLKIALACVLATSPQLWAETDKAPTPAEATQTSAEQQEKINVNTAGLIELQNLKGIGPAKAQRILSFREEHGAFKSLEALTQIKGISLKVLEQNKGRLTI